MGAVRWTVVESFTMSGEVSSRVLEDAVYVQTLEPVLSGEDMQRIATAIGAFW